MPIKKMKKSGEKVKLSVALVNVLNTKKNYAMNNLLPSSPVQWDN